MEDVGGLGPGNGAGIHAADGKVFPNNVFRRRVSVSFNETKAARRRRILNLVRMKGLGYSDRLCTSSTAPKYSRRPVLLRREDVMLRRFLMRWLVSSCQQLLKSSRIGVEAIP